MAADTPGVIYLIHLEPTYKQAGHYLGWTGNGWGTRLRQHLRGQGNPLVRAAVKAGSTVILARLWKGDRNAERRLKNRKEGPRLCPVCKALGRVERGSHEGVI